MKKTLVRSLGLACVGSLLLAGSAMAASLNPYNTRQVTINSAAAGENSLQTELNNVFGPGVVNAATDQISAGMFQIANPGSNTIVPQLKFEWTSNAPSQTVGLFGWDAVNNTTINAQVFSGAAVAGYFSTVNWTTSSTGTISRFDNNGNFLSSAGFSGVDRNFFGFYFTPNGNSPTYYSVDSLNPNGTARVLAYQPNPSGMLFSYEDGGDFDYQDAGFFVESIKPVPEPATMLLLGTGLVGLAGARRKRAAKKA